MNCLKHPRHDVDAFRARIQSALASPAELGRIAAAGTALVRTRYHHDAVARQLHADIAALYQGRTSSRIAA